MISRQAVSFSSRGILLLGCFYLLTLGATALLEGTVDWREWQDPRRRILWEGVDPDAKIIVIGDSAFVSGYVDREEHTLWRQLEEQAHQRVFNGALDGAEPVDFVKISRLLAQHNGGNKTVLLDIIPTRFLPSRVAQSERGNYQSELYRRVADDPRSWIMVKALQPLHVLDLERWLSLVKRKRYFGTDEYHQVVWNQDDGRALARFAMFEKFWIGGGRFESFSWVSEVESILCARGYELILVLTPVNWALVREYARVRHPREYERRISQVHDAFVGYLRAEAIPYIDAFDAFQSNEFADLVHTNALGDKHIAELIASALGNSTTRVGGHPAEAGQ